MAAPIPGSKIVVEKDWIVEISQGKFFFLSVFYANKLLVLICLLPDINRQKLESILLFILIGVKCEF